MVDLPQPEGPTTATNSPGATTRSMPSSARRRPPSKILTRPLTSMAGASLLIAEGLHGREPDCAEGGVGGAGQGDDNRHDEGADEDVDGVLGLQQVAVGLVEEV